MNRDVRMRGFSSRTEVEAVLRLLEQRVRSPDAAAAEDVAVTEATGRVLAVDVDAPCDVPGFDRSAMDGFALKGSETFGATSMAPLTFEIIGEARPGHPFKGVVGPGQAVRIMTGAPVPDGADAVLMAEKCSFDGESVAALDAVAPEKNIGRRGEDIRRGTRLFDVGRVLRPQDAGVLASVGASPVRVFRKPRVTVLVTGDELLPPGSKPSGTQIVDSNSVVLSPLIERDGGMAHVEQIVRDDRDTMRDALRAATPGAIKGAFNAVLVCGGSSVGSEDHMPTLVAEEGELCFHGVALRPASPAGVGFVADCPVFLIPGNPVSCLCAYEFFAGPAIRRLAGLPMTWPHQRVRATVRRKIVSMVGRVDYVRVALDDHDGETGVTPIATSGASILTSTTRAAGAVIVPKDSEGHAPGETVEVLLY